jgi:hypothetical protein
VCLSIGDQKKLKEDAVSMKLYNVYGSPTHEKMLLPLVKTISSSVRNAFQQDVRFHLHFISWLIANNVADP